MTYAEDAPVNWQRMRLRDIATQFLSGGTPSTKKLEYWTGSIPWTTSAAIEADSVTLGTAERHISQSAIRNSATNIVPAQNLLVSTRVGVGKAAVNLNDLAISQDLTGVVLDSTMDSLFAAYQFKTDRVQRHLLGRRRGTTIQGISRFDLESVELHLPPLMEQRAITHSLETIREGLAICRRELALERERKAALTQHLFTYGVNGSTASTRTTLFGQVPAHWRSVPLSECARIQSGVTLGRQLGATPTVMRPYLRVANVQDGYLDLTEMKQVAVPKTDVERYRLCHGDVVLTEGGDADKLGRGFVWRDEIPDCLHQNHIFAVRTQQGVLLPEYLAYLIQSVYGKAYFLSVAHRTTNLASINSTKLKAFPALLPSLAEQTRIVEALNKSDAKIASVQDEISLNGQLLSAMLEALMSGCMPVQALDTGQPFEISV